MRNLLYTVLALSLLFPVAVSQGAANDLGKNISGKIVDAKSKVPIEYATVILFDQSDSSQITGAFSHPDGSFEIPGVKIGQYYLEVRYMGFETWKMDGIKVGQQSVKLPPISLKQTVINMEGIAIEGERAAITYDIDKKVINVSKQQTAISGTAVDVLENVPSITVDMEGNISLRGSGNFRVLVDGRPSVIESNEVLQQIPATSIENIEIITNPSAKYNPEGTAGIINVILKKNQAIIGKSALINVNAGMSDKYGGDAMFDFKRPNYHATFGLDYRRFTFSGLDRGKSRTEIDGLNSFIDSEGDADRGRKSMGMRGSYEVKFGSRDVLNLSGRLGHGSFINGSRLTYDEWAEPDMEHLLYTSINSRQRKSNYIDLNLSHGHDFLREGHRLYGEISFSSRDGDEETINERHGEENVITSGRKSLEIGPSSELQAKIDYALPLSDKSKLEAGIQSEFERSIDETEAYDFNPQTGVYELLSLFSNKTRYYEATHSSYSILSSTLGRIGFQAGLRGEYTYRKIGLSKTGERFIIDQVDFFPTFHSSLKLPNDQQVMASYTRRIDRPRNYHLEPFQTWIDAFNVHEGNPALKPEYIDSYEMGYQVTLGQSLLSAEGYYRVAQNKIEDLRTVYAENRTLHSVANVGKDYAFGTELMLNFDPIRKWNANLMGNLYNYRIKGILLDEPFSRESFNWNIRLNNSIDLARRTQFQVHSTYNSPTVSSQGRRESFFRTNVALKQEFLERKLAVTLQVRNVFGTAKWESVSEGRGFYSYDYHERESSVLIMNVKYNFNNFNRERDRGEDENGSDSGEN
jgi:outer membrane receptor protein involved in Fe transport